jgi:RNA polymerase sigma-70 factor (ECF subfamily)
MFQTTTSIFCAASPNGARGPPPAGGFNRLQSIGWTIFPIRVWSSNCQPIWEEEMSTLNHDQLDPEVSFGPHVKEAIASEMSAARTEEVFRTLAQDHEDALYRSALKQSHNQADAHDLVQEVFERALRKRPPIRDRQELRSWLMRVLFNLFIDRCRSKQRQTIWMDLDTLPAPQREPEPLWSTVSVEAIVALLPRLRPILRGVFALHIDGKSIPAIASRLRISARMVSTRLFRARRELRTLWLTCAGSQERRALASRKNGTTEPSAGAPGRQLRDQVQADDRPLPVSSGRSRPAAAAR